MAMAKASMAYQRNGMAAIGVINKLAANGVSNINKKK